MVGALLPLLVSTFITKAGTPSLAPTPRLIWDCRPLSDRRCRALCVTAPGKSPWGAHGQGPGRLLRERDGGSGKPAGRVLHLNRILIGRWAT